MKNPGTVRFLLNGYPVHIDFHAQTEFTPTTTLLQYLRTNPDLTGTKEGCAEGDCGACTVVLVSPENQGNEQVLAIDSCLVFLPMIHGMAIITVEQLAQSRLHPVQKAMIDFDGSQCGYCTPGFIMSMYALHQNHSDPDREVIDDALTGNLCRCTGYRSIVEAAVAACKKAEQNGAVKTSYKTLKSMDLEPLSIVQDAQKYFQPDNLDYALSLRSMYPAAILINGATDVALRVTKNDERLETLIDLSRIPELRSLDRSDDSMTFGAGLTLEEIKLQCQQKLPALFNCLAVFGSVQIRNLATLGGNIASASPIGDTPPLLMAYGATINLVSPGGKRSLPLADFIAGYRKTQLKSTEIIVSITVPIPTRNYRVAWYKISKRKDLDISSVSAGFRLKLNQDRLVEDIALYYGGMAEKTCLAEKTSKFLLGQPWTRPVISEAIGYLHDDFTPISDARASAQGRTVMARNLLWKLWTDTNEPG